MTISYSIIDIQALQRFFPGKQYYLAISGILSSVFGFFVFGGINALTRRFGDFSVWIVLVWLSFATGLFPGIFLAILQRRWHPLIWLLSVCSILLFYSLSIILTVGICVNIVAGGPVPNPVYSIGKSNTLYIIFSLQLLLFGTLMAVIKYARKFLKKFD